MQRVRLSGTFTENSHPSISAFSSACLCFCQFWFSLKNVKVSLQWAVVFGKEKGKQRALYITAPDGKQTESATSNRT